MNPPAKTPNCLVSEQLNQPSLFQYAKDITSSHFHKKVMNFTPGWNFPSISITGKKCALKCAHCNHHFLTHMTPALTPVELEQTLTMLIEKGSIGCLLSGGFTKEGILPIEPFLPVIKEITGEHDFQIVLHSGLVSQNQAKNIADAGIEIVSVDLIGSKSTIQRVYGLNKTPRDFLQNIITLKEAGIPSVVPHVTLGLEYGNIKGEINALDDLSNIFNNESLQMLVFLILIPVAGSQMERISPPHVNEVSQLIAACRICFPDTEIALGCMRPTTAQRIEYDIKAVESGVTRIVMIRPEAKDHLQQKGYSIIERTGCCTLP